ncbi:MAG: hypothetical protein QM820_14025 [Minicystis sp.]
MSHRGVLEVRYAWLDHLPAPLFQLVVTHVHGQIEPRGKAILALREALLSGRVPPAEALAWPEEPLRSTLVAALEAANVAPYCDADAEITDDILRFVLDVVRDAGEVHDRALVAFHALARKDEKEAARRARAAGCSGGDGADGGGDGADGGDVAGVSLDDVRRDAAQLICDMIRARTQVRWAELAVIYGQLAGVFAALCAAVGLPPGMERGMLRALPRTELLEMRRMLSYLPALQALVRELGRMRETSDPGAESVLERIGRVVVRTQERDRPVRGDRGAEVRGIERSGEVARMLPSEAVLLTHPVLRTLWHARWAESALLTYRAEGVYTKRIQEQQTFEDGEAQRALRAERGPVLIVLDTSASMEGFPETVAKAIVVQIVGVCFLERRACYVYNFSGPGDLEERALSFDGDGLAQMLAFASQSFHGGTDVDEALRRACDRIDTDAYRQADLAVISDGCFSTGPHVVTRLRALREHSATRLHGIVVGNGRGFEELPCDSVSEIAGWGADAVRD